jgi:hypothetical protein
MANSTTIPKTKCICGAITVTFSAPPDNVSFCYCRDCQQNSGGPCQQNLYVSKSNFTIGENPDRSLKCYTFTNTKSGKPKEKYFCGTCGATVFTRPMVLGGDTYVLKGGIVENGY